MKWTHKDWIWLFIFIIFISIYNEIKSLALIEVISYISTFVSIALAAVAIYISVREATKADTIKNEMNIILGEMKEKLGQVDTKINDLNPSTIKNNIEKFKEEVQEIGKDYIDLITAELQKNDGENQKKSSIDNLKDAFENNINKAGKNFKNSLIENDENYDLFQLLIWRELEEFLRKTEEIELGITEDDIGFNEKTFKLKKYIVNYSKRSITIIFSNNNETISKDFKDIVEIRYSILTDEKIKVWIYMESITWRFYLNIKNE
ncbi:hypothetical protein MKX57_17475 [Lysinibacillus sp. FSL M8-0216]|uniref:hypothetical protein n=1 Tax=Lysinibacillus sp. FSL M8-0216 TaxID=2921619 RepID=UPI00315B2B02